jgi:cytochrome P450
MELVNFIDELTGERVGSPDRGDILSDLAARETAGELTRGEVIGLGWSIIIAGSDTAANLLAGGTELLIRDRTLGQRLAADPDKTDDFMEEFLRLFSPQQWVARRLNEDVTLHGVTMPEGSIVHIVLGSANRDPRKFDNPDVFDLDRPNIDEHMAFGGGRHFCPGAAIGREFSGLAFRSLYPHLHRISLDPAQPAQLRTGPGNYGFENMGLVISEPETATAGV